MSDINDVDFSQLKIPQGRPLEPKVNRVSLTPYMRSAKFQRLTTQFFNYWDVVVKNKAKGNSFFVENMEAFFGEILDKFEDLSEDDQELVLQGEAPFSIIVEKTSLKVPDLFDGSQDKKDFKEIFLTHNF